MAGCQVCGPTLGAGTGPSPGERELPDARGGSVLTDGQGYR